MSSEGPALPTLASHVAETLMNGAKVPERGRGRQHARCLLAQSSSSASFHSSLQSRRKVDESEVSVGCSVVFSVTLWTVAR